MGRLYLGLALIAVLGAYTWVVFSWGASSSTTKTIITTLENNENARRTHAELEKEIMGLPDPDLNIRWSKWLRN